jgi:hypothetical protein
MDKIDVSANEKEIVINCPGLKGVGYIVLSPSQARRLAEVLVKFADQIEDAFNNV